jgi:hypothetical protein
MNQAETAHRASKSTSKLPREITAIEPSFRGMHESDRNEVQRHDRLARKPDATLELRIFHLVSPHYFLTRQAAIGIG